MPTLLLALGLSLLAPSQPIHGQVGHENPADEGGDLASEHMSTALSVRAVRATAPIVIDGRPDEPVWSTAPAITDFTQIEPDEGAPVSQRTEVRILYDEDNLYVAGWMYDTGPISTRLGRRDSRWMDTDALWFFIDTYHDHHTAYRFTVNPSGVMRDEILTGGGTGGGALGTGSGDDSWDAVWETRSTITDEGWFFEMRIPFSQLRFPPGEEKTFGLQMERRIGRNLEHASWSFTPRLERATIARFGHLEGITGIRTSGRLELLPFVTARAEYLQVPQSGAVDFANPFRSGSDYFADAGLDLKYRIGSNLTLDATFNPDFGQVEMDPAEINLTAFETRLGERRPFFVEGAEIFSFGQSGGMNTQLLYSRRIGRSPQLPAPGGSAYADVPGSATILGAFKLTGKTVSGWSGGLLEAYTGRVTAPYVDVEGTPHRAVVEPGTNYLAGRVRRDLGEGSTSVGGIATSAVRALGDDEVLLNRLHGSAFSGGVDFRHEWNNRRWSLAGELTGSYVEGEPAALLRTQRTSARYFHRPDADHLELDPDATSLAGYGTKLAFGKQTGAWTGETVFTAISPSFETNDIGFQTNADRLDLRGDFGYQQTRPGTLLRSWRVRASSSALWNFGRERIGTDVGFQGNVQLLSNHSANIRLGRSFSTWNDRMTRSGPLTRDPATVSGNAGFNTDNRRMVTLRVGSGFNTSEAGSWRWNANLNLGVTPSEAVNISGGPSVSRNHNVAQYVTSVADPHASHTFGRRYVFAPIDQTTVSFDTRMNFTVSPMLTFQLSVEPLLGSGRYGPLKELAAPRSFDFLEYGSDVGTITLDEDGRYTVNPDGEGPAQTFGVNNQDFNVRSLQGNAVVRWEWRPGSTLYLVWQQVRSDRLTALSSPDGAGRRIGEFELGDDVRDLLGLKPENVFMMKVNYWLNP